MSEPNNLHIDQFLSNVSKAYRNDATIWPDIFPVVPVGKRSDKYLVLDKEHAFREADDMLGPNALPNEIGISYSDDNYSVESHGLADWLAQEHLDNADAPVSLESDVTEHLSDTLDLTQERRVAALAFAAGTYPSGNKVQLVGGSPGTQWNDPDGDPVGDVRTAVESTFMRANTLVFGLDAWLVFQSAAKVLEHLHGLQGKKFATEAEVAAMFGVQRVLVGRARVNTAKPGQTPSYARVWGKHVAALHVGPSAGIKTITFGKTFSTEPNKLTYRDFDGRRGEKGSHYFKVAWNSDEKIVASELGYFIEDAVA